MEVFSSPAFDDHEQVVFFFDRGSGLNAIVALHDTTLGPALGGCRMWPYATEADAITDVLRLSKGMTFKAAMADPAVRRRQKRDHRRSATESPKRCSARSAAASTVSAAATRARMSAPARRTWTGRARRPRSSGPHARRRQRRPVAGHGARRLVRDPRRRPAQAAAGRTRRRARGHPGPGACRLQPGAAARRGRRPADRRRPRSGTASARRTSSGPSGGVDAILSVECDVLAPCALGGVLNDDTILGSRARSWPARPTISCSRTDTVRRCMRAASCTRRIT